MLDDRLKTRLESIEQRFVQLEEQMADPEVATDPRRLMEVGRERSDLEELVTTYRRYTDVERHVVEAEELRDGPDPDLAQYAREELERLLPQYEAALEAIKKLLLPKDPNDDKNVIMEIRAGTGGEEAALFAEELFRMYVKYAEKKGWKTEVLSSSPSDIGGMKEIILEVRGKGAYSHLRYESGPHRVQRVPVTESQGRIHTSAATVAVLPEAEEVDIDIRDEDVKVDVYRAAGHGGQGVNTTDSAVRLTHIPSGIVVTCQDQRSQLQNKARAMVVLRSRLYEMELEKRQKELGDERRSQVKSGDRSDKIRTYNFPDDRVTDHRIKLTVSGVPRFLQGEIDNMVETLRLTEQAERLRAAGLDGA
jgi:peptide chain release factor 1